MIMLVRRASLLAFAVASSALSAQATTPQSAPSTAAPAAAATTAAVNPDDKVKCKSTTVIGSLSKKVRVCRTIAEWRSHNERGSEAAREIADYSRSRQSGN